MPYELELGKPKIVDSEAVLQAMPTSLIPVKFIPFRNSAKTTGATELCYTLY